MKQPPKNPNQAQLLRYANISFQMMVLIIGGALGGRYLDKQISLSFPIFTLVGCVVSVFLAVYFAIKEVLKK